MIKILNKSGEVIKTIETDTLSGVDLNGANLNGANLNGADLGGANLRSAINLPEIISIPGLFISINNKLNTGGILEMRNWHTCATTHCIAGWVVTIAGEAGRVAENLLGTSAAASLIIDQSCPYLEGKVPNFYASNEDDLDFIKSCIEKEEQIHAAQ